MTERRRWLRWAIGAVVAVAVLAVGVPFVYIHFVEGPAPKPLSLGSGLGSSASPGSGTSGSASGTGSTSGTGAGSGTGSAASGTWRVGTGSVVGYRVNEVLVGQNNVAVGRTNSVAGDLVISGSTVKSASFTVRMVTIKSDQSERDVQFDGRIMDVAAYPTGGFALTRPIALGQPPTVGQVKSYQATGNLTLHGHTRPVTFTLSAERTSSGIRISGSIPVKFADWDIPNPSFGSFVTTANHGTLEFLLDFLKA